MQIEKIINLIQTDDSVDAPADSLKAAKNIFRQARPHPKASLLQRIVAVLSADLLPDRPAFGERSASTLKSRQILYTAGDTGIDIRVSAAAGDFDVHGQLLTSELIFDAARLYNADRSFEAAVDEFGDFTFGHVNADAYSLSISGGDKEIFIEQIDLR